ncbi:MAG TPA: NUDIX hydrolase [Candidatus Marinimicrobia bacterium]|jgi:ADP-ribose pyrophosphatase|nr:NUDIX hydrolase [Candidatus Neomarinimicrobiota bacterium]MDP7329675.1 NUDIX hydrolase [Candidatus Neomarinimicrobiota bacterium]MDP7436291.1 NUDIX hydrolase [Candidatus Neomarinimicrobiota bacterium]HBN45876.1 ADP-ribose pyrophosphatase [Candidatus Neomarinimicrobiota bacterium]HJL75432.1 NUDIX hydrolase [Candidatus Neomarinimicrobiota bacterium]|tara:strand:- start:229 stop:765 length:537 start_codon:yes stop_codon:yes gene_type:complete
MSKLKETQLSTEQIYKGSLLDVRRDEVSLPNGKTSAREWIKHPGAACIIPVLPDSKIALIKQYRYPVQAEMIELPAGKLDPGEDPEQCANRELEEEIGYSAGKLTFICNIHPAIGFASEKMWIYLAEELTATKENTDHDEFVELIPTGLEDAVQMVWAGKITDVKTIIGILWAEQILK